MRNMVYADVHKSKDKLGNKEFTNKEARDAETEKRLQGGEDYQKLAKEIEILNETISTEQINLEYMKRRFRAVEALTRM